MKYITVVNNEKAYITDASSTSQVIYDIARQLKKTANHTLKGDVYKLEFYKGGKKALADKPTEKRTIRCYPNVPTCVSRRGHKWIDEYKSRDKTVNNRRCIKCGLVKVIIGNAVAYAPYHSGDAVKLRRARVNDAADYARLVHDVKHRVLSTSKYQPSLDAIAESAVIIRQGRVFVAVDEFDNTMYGACVINKNWGKSARLEAIYIHLDDEELASDLLKITLKGLEIPVRMVTNSPQKDFLEKQGFKYVKEISNYYRTGTTAYEYVLEAPKRKAKAKRKARKN